MRPYEKEDTLRQFLENDRRVLRFYCFWDDTDSMFGDPRECVLHYFLADDTIEFREIIPPNSGRDAVPLFLKRQKLPKVCVSSVNLGLKNLTCSYNFIYTIDNELQITSSKLDELSTTSF